MSENILILLQGSQRSIYIESMIFDLQKRGYTVVVGSLGVAGGLQEFLIENGFDCYTFDKKRKPLFSFYFSNYLFWKKIIKQHDIKIVFSHLQWANFIALIIGIFSFRKLCVIPTRHHIDASFLHESRNAKIEDFIINLLAKRQVVVSEYAKRFMLKNEFFARKSKIFYIPLGYEFQNYKTLSSGSETKIRGENSCELLLLIIARLIKTKRHFLVIEAVKILKDRGLDIKLIILDDGPEKINIQKKIESLDVADKIKMYGHQKFIVDFIRAADLLVQPSIEESSNQVVKEASIQGRTAIVTKHIGDFDDYIIDKKNAFFIDKETSVYQLADLINEIYLKKYDLALMAKSLESSVRQRFSIAHTVDEYIKLSQK